MASQQDKQVLKALRRAGSRGVANHQFHALRVMSYTKVISDLRKEGYNIITERVQLRNGRYTNTYRYILVEGELNNWEQLLIKLLTKLVWR